MAGQMNRCVIAGAAPFTDAATLQRYLRADDYCIAADGGQRLLKAIGWAPDLIVGDFDSSALPSTDGVPVCTLPTHKDDTDVVAAAKIALQKGYRDFLLLGCTGGRLDHTLGNLLALRFLLEHAATALLADEQQEVRLYPPGRYTVPPKPGYALSLLPFGEDVRHITLRQVGYPLEDGCLPCTHPLGVSNEFTDRPAEIAFSEGYLLVIVAKDA